MLKTFDIRPRYSESESAQNLVNRYVLPEQNLYPCFGLKLSSLNPSRIDRMIEKLNNELIGYWEIYYPQFLEKFKDAKYACYYVPEAKEFLTYIYTEYKLKGFGSEQKVSISFNWFGPNNPTQYYHGIDTPTTDYNPELARAMRKFDNRCNTLKYRIAYLKRLLHEILADKIRDSYEGPPYKYTKQTVGVMINNKPYWFHVWNKYETWLEVEHIADPTSGHKLIVID